MGGTRPISVSHIRSFICPVFGRPKLTVGDFWKPGIAQSYPDLQQFQKRLFLDLEKINGRGVRLSYAQPILKERI